MAISMTASLEQSVQWLLNHANPEVYEMREILSRCTPAGIVPTDQEIEGPNHLNILHKQLMHIENGVRFLVESNTESHQTKEIDTSEERQSELSHLSTQDNITLENTIEMIKQIEKSLSTVDTLMFTLNKLKFEGKAPIEEEIVSLPNSSISIAERHSKFIDHAKRVRSNLSIIETFVSPQKKPQNEPYQIPKWSTAPQNRFYFEVRKGEEIINKIAIHQKGTYFIGRLLGSDIFTPDNTCSRNHAVIQFRPGNPNSITGEREDEVYLFDLGSTSGTQINGFHIHPNVFYPLFSSDVIQFGKYDRFYSLRDGTETHLCPPDSPTLNGEDHMINDDTIAPTVDNDNETKPADSLEPELDVHVIEEESNPLKKKEKISNEVEQEGEEEEEEEEHKETPVSVVSKKEDGMEKESEKEEKKLEEKCKEQKKKKKQPVGPFSGSFDEEEYKRKMVEAYEKQQRENAAILAERKEREAKGLPPLCEVPFVPERPQRKSTTKPKKKKWWKKY